MAEILEQATALVAQNGYYGLSLQDLADHCGITQAGLLHHVGSKQGLLEKLIEQRYDRQGTPADYLATGDPAATHPDGISLPGYFRYLVAHNAARPQLVQLYMVLGAEAAADDHPAHHYFIDRPTEVLDFYRTFDWRLPEAVGGFEGVIEVIEMSLEAMDGIQVRLFRRPAIDMVAEWARFERILFPSPLWDGYR